MGLDRRDRERGFALIEVIAALAILALALGVLLDTISGGVLRSDRARRLAEATATAQSLLAKIGSEMPMAPATGELTGGLRWEVRVEPYGEAGARADQPVSAAVVRVQVSWNDYAQDSVTLTTLRLGSARFGPGP